MHKPQVLAPKVTTWTWFRRSQIMRISLESLILLQIWNYTVWIRDLGSEMLQITGKWDIIAPKDCKWSGRQLQNWKQSHKVTKPRKISSPVESGECVVLIATTDAVTTVYLIPGDDQIKRRRVHPLDDDFPLGISSSQLTFTPSFFRGVGWNYQPGWFWVWDKKWIEDLFIRRLMFWFVATGCSCLLNLGVLGKIPHVS